MVKDKYDKIRILVDDYDKESISVTLLKLQQIQTAIKQLKDFENVLSKKVKHYMKDKGWTNYTDQDTKISVSLNTDKKKLYDDDQLSRFLSKSELAMVVHLKNVETLNIIDQDTRKRLNKLIKK